MSTSNEVTKAAKADASLTKGVIDLGRYYFWRAANWARPYLGGRRGLIFLAVAVVGAGATFNWGWLVAIGIAPIILALAPCVVMCGLGLCMMKGGGKSCSSGDQSAKGSSGTDITTKSREEN